MGLFGKKRVSELEAAALFVHETLKTVRDRWAAASGEFRFLLEDQAELLDDPWVQYEFAMAVIAVQSQALPNLLPAPRAVVIHALIRQCLDVPELDGVGVDAFDVYHDAWLDGLESGEMPFAEVASTLFDRLELTQTNEVGGVRFKSPVVIAALGGFVVAIGGAWWKSFLAKHELVS